MEFFFEGSIMEIQKDFKKLLELLNAHKVAFVIIGVMSCLLLVSCRQQQKPAESVSKDTILLTIDFHKDQPLRYKFSSSRDITVQWNPPEKASTTIENVSSKSSESMDVVVVFTPGEINRYGPTTIKATCESVEVKRSDGTQTDAAKSFAGKSYSFTVGPAGKIEDYSQLNELIKQIGQKAFQSGTDSERIKEPDMIGDYIATQWFLWDSVSSIENASQGVQIGQSWQSKLSIPTPMVSRLARNVTYNLEKIGQSEKGRLAVIRSIYSKTDSVPESWPIPYTGKFLMKGKFGLLGGYKLLDIQGQGEELFNADLGRIEQYNQQYRLKLLSSMMMGINVNPEIIIEQNLTMKIIEN